MEYSSNSNLHFSAKCIIFIGIFYSLTKNKFFYINKVLIKFLFLESKDSFPSETFCNL